MNGSMSVMVEPSRRCWLSTSVHPLDRPGGRGSERFDVSVGDEVDEVDEVRMEDVSHPWRTIKT